MKVLRLILFPFTFIYGLVVTIRNLLFDWGLFKSHTFPIPIISVGNLTVGGAGKSPMTEYLVALLKNDYKLATLSRGYGRKTKGYREARANSEAFEVGDEPLQFKNKFPDITVAVDEKRVEGIQKLQEDHNLIILDDAYQHRSVKPGLSILLFEYSAVLKPQWFLPTGDLREPFSGRKRADILVFTKSPQNLSEAERQRILEKVNPFKHQQVFFSHLKYGDLKHIKGTGVRKLDSLKNESALFLLTGIANPKPLLNEMRRYTPNIYHHAYPDHHHFTPKNIAKIVQEYLDAQAQDKLIITTEKDLQRLKAPALGEHLKDLPVYYLPIKAAFNPGDKARFEQLILNYAKKHLRNH